jgi:putative transposase
MRKSRFTEQQVICIVKEGEAGANIADLCRRHEISKESYYRWRAKYGRLEVNEARRLRQLEEENRRLKHLVADLTLDKQTLQELVRKKF